MPLSPALSSPRTASPHRTVSRLSVAIVDDHPAIRDALCQAVENRMSTEVVAESGSSEEALRLVEEHGPDVAIVDLSLSDGLSFGLIEALRGEHPETDILVFSMYEEKVYAERALRSGASGYIMKPAGTEEVLRAAEKVGRGGVHLSPNMTTRVLGETQNGQGKELRFPIDGLTDKELDVFKLVGRGMSASAIADELGLTRKTVEAHRRKAKEKLGYETIHEVTSHAVRWVQAEAQTESA